MSRGGAMTGRPSSFLPPTAVRIWTCCLTTPVREDSLARALGRAHGEEKGEKGNRRIYLDTTGTAFTALAAK